MENDTAMYVVFGNTSYNCLRIALKVMLIKLNDQTNLNRKGEGIDLYVGITIFPADYRQP